MLKLIVILAILRQTGFSSIAQLFLRSQAIAQFFRMSPNPLTFESLETGDSSLKFGRTMSNYWGRDKRFIVDGQSIDDNMQYQVGISRYLKMGLEMSSRRFSDDRMDEVAVGFHDMFMIPQDKRLLVNRNSTRVVAPDYGLEITEDHLFEPVSEQVGLKLVSQNFTWGDTQLSAALQGSYEMAPQSLIKKGARDWGFQLGAYRQWSSSFSYAIGNLMVFDGYKDARLYLRSRQTSLLMGYGYSFDNTQAVIFQTMLGESAYRDIGQLSRISYEVHLGYRKQWKNWGLEFSFLENIFWPFNAPDWGVNLNILYALKN